MFTGIVEGLGRVERVEKRRLWLALPWRMKSGSSVAVNGVCLTVVRAGKNVPFDASPETLRCTDLGDLRPGDRVNLERPMAASGRLGGHWVQGHVDAAGRILEIRGQKGAWWFRFSIPREIAKYIVRKGSVAVDGISLTVAARDKRSFAVAVIPHTWERTNLHRSRVGDRVNLEADILAKYVERIFKR